MKPNWFIAFPVETTEWFLKLDSTPPGTRYFHPDDLHVTFSFLGPVDEEDALRAWEVAKKLEGGPFEFQLGRVEPFGGNRSRPSAYAVAPGNSAAELKEFLAIHRNEVARAAYARPDSRSPRPHITVARPRRRSTEKERDWLHDWAREQRVAGETLRLDRLGLYSWSEERDEKLFKLIDTTYICDPVKPPTAVPAEEQATSESTAPAAPAVQQATGELPESAGEQAAAESVEDQD